MGLVYSHYLDLAAPHTQARVKPDASASVRPAARGQAAASPRRAVSAVARALLPAHDAPTRDRRPFVPSAVLLKGRGRDVDSLADHERARAALGRIQHQIAADHDAWTSHVGVPAYPVGRGEHP